MLRSLFQLGMHLLELTNICGSVQVIQHNMERIRNHHFKASQNVVQCLLWIEHPVLWSGCKVRLLPWVVITSSATIRRAERIDAQHGETLSCSLWQCKHRLARNAAAQACCVSTSASWSLLLQSSMARGLRRFLTGLREKQERCQGCCLCSRVTVVVSQEGYRPFVRAASASLERLHTFAR